MPEPAQLKCLQCGGRLQQQAEQWRCPACGGAWLIEGGIVRFARTPYWGEIPQDEARALVAEARQQGWRAAANRRFTDRDMNISVLDPQRASWLPMLGLGTNAVALDIGSGMGVLTHALARSLGTVYSVEAIAERIEFTQARVQQEGLENVHLVQTAAAALPFFEGTFDLIVINGVLEWVGEWDLEGTPREAQLRFLKNAARLLKPGGVAMIGIENRWGYGNFLGARDHSGLPYTSLMPRRAATQWLRRSAAQHHRTRLNAKREYRTYTYSARGYRRLLRDAGFSSATLWWADPGYNQPYHLIPLSAAQMVREHLRDMFDLPQSKQPRRAKKIIKELLVRTPGFAFLVPDFIMFAGREQFHGGGLGPWWLEQLPPSAQTEREAFQLASRTYPFSSKQVLRMWQPERARYRALAKVELRERDAAPDPPQEFESLQRLQTHLQSQTVRYAQVPRPIAARAQGNAFVFLESFAPGTQFSRTVRSPGYFHDPGRVRREFETAMRAGIELTRNLSSFQAAPIDPGWQDLGALVPAASAPIPAPGWVQHGDFTIENLFLDPGSEAVGIIDWATVGAGYPPLYDLFTLALSAGYVEPALRQARFASEEELAWASFQSLFAGSNSISTQLCELLVGACGQLNVEASRIPELLLGFLVVRTHSFRARDSQLAARIHLHLLEQFLATRERLVFGRFPLRLPAVERPVD